MLFDFLYRGGPFFMYPLLFILIVVLVLVVRGFVKNQTIDKAIKLVGSLTIFAVVWGFLGQIIGLMAAFETIEEVGDISPAVLAGGLKISFIAPAFGMFIFLIGRIGIIALTWVKK